LTLALRPDDTQLSKFHGFYQQDDRDQRAERQQQQLEPLHSFMLRVCIPGGVLQPAQWLALDRLAEQYGDGGLRATTRQAVQLHGVVRGALKPTIAAIDAAVLSTLAGCGDVNRNVMCTPVANSARLLEQLEATARRLSRALSPRTAAYRELWLDGKPAATAEAEPTPVPEALRSKSPEEPLYGDTYLPRKFKIGIALPPSNDVDVYTQDLGLIAITEGERLLGFNVLVGGGMGRSHGDATTYPLLAQSLGFVTEPRLLTTAMAVLTAQRDLGDRTDRRHSRLKYTVERVGVAAFRAEVERRQGYAFDPERPFTFTSTSDRFGWFHAADTEHLLVPLPSGRVRDTEASALRTALRELALVHRGTLRLTPNQNLLFSNVHTETRAKLEELVTRFRLLPPRSAVHLRALSCVALPTCGLAMAEAERYLPRLLQRLEAELEPLGLHDEPLVLRMTGCPNGCARPYAAEIALVGKALGLYDLYLGGRHDGSRLARLVAHTLDEEGVLGHLRPLFSDFSRLREPGESFGDFWCRTYPS